ncbi:BamA/TamA family outer membrane protein [Thalassotalea litorea]|uniref:BamA/TamA family outer membrane protein n=1 Tax=Thalassotalea litorea TaxID=2020715 RepID=UPI0037360615
MTFTSLRNIIILLAILLSTPSQAKKFIEPTITDDAEEMPLDKPDFKGLPFAFHTEMLKTTVGAAGVIKHAWQPQATLFSGGFYSQNNSWAIYGGAYNYQPFSASQWLISSDIMRAHYTQGFYRFVNDIHDPSFNQPERQLLGARQGFSRITLDYVLPIGAGKKGAIATLRQPSSPHDLEDIENWLPGESGFTTLTFMPFRKYLKYDDQRATDAQISEISAGIELEINYDNRNSTTMPSQGFQFQTRFIKDFGDSRRAGYSQVEAEYSQFVSLGANKFFQQQTIAFNALLADTPSWNSKRNGEYQRPPNFDGVTLGGWDSLRGYDTNRFYGRAAFSYGLEYRAIPAWHPLPQLPIIENYRFPWWQWVVFVDAGQISDKFNLSELHEDMKFSFGGGIRMNIEGIIARIDYAQSSEGSQLRVIINQPF